MNILNYIQYLPDIFISTHQAFLFLDILILSFSSYSENSGSVFFNFHPLLILWILVLALFSLYLCTFFSVLNGFSVSGCPVEYLDRFQKSMGTND